MGWFGLRTLGVRILVTDEDRILLIRHTYTPLWHFPGGGVKPHEVPIDGAKRELLEETGLIAKNLNLLGIYHNPHYGRDDDVILYHVMDFDIVEKIPCHEIAEIKWFSKNTLPEDISPATRTRIDEWQKKREVSKTW